MFFVFKPSDRKIGEFIADQSRLSFSYAEIGITKNDRSTIDNYPVNYLRRELGKGRKVYEKASDAVRCWQMYDLNWTKIYPKNAPIEPETTVAVLVKHLGIWSLNSCRIVYTFDEITPEIERFGFAFGTLPAHSEMGEERFSVELNRATGQVFYEIYAVARAHHWLARIGAPFVRLMQKRFAAQSYQTMRDAIDS